MSCYNRGVSRRYIPGLQCRGDTKRWFECTARCFTSTGVAHWTTGIQRVLQCHRIYITARGCCYYYIFSVKQGSLAGRKENRVTMGKNDAGDEDDKTVKKWNGSAKDLDDFDKKIARWCRKQYGTTLGNQLWEKSMPDLEDLHGADCKPGGGPTQFKGSRKGRRRWPRAVAARKKCASAAYGGSKARRREGGKWRRQQPSPCCSSHWGKHAPRKNAFEDPPPPFCF